jgi:hypothetical protein
MEMFPLLLEKKRRYRPVTMAVSPAADTPAVTSSAVELQEKPERPLRPNSNDDSILPPTKRSPNSQVISKWKK